LDSSQRVKDDLAELKGWYSMLGAEFDPLR